MTSSSPGEHPEGSDPHVYVSTLAKFFENLSVTELRTLVADIAPGAHLELPPNTVPPKAMAFDAATIVANHNALDAIFLHKLLELRPRRTQEIEQLARVAGISLSVTSETTVEPSLDGQQERQSERRLSRRNLAIVGAVALTGTATYLLTKEPPANRRRKRKKYRSSRAAIVTNLPAGIYLHRKSRKIYLVNDEHKLVHPERNINQNHLKIVPIDDIVAAVRNNKIAYNYESRSAAIEYIANHLLLAGRYDDAITVLTHGIHAILNSPQPKETLPPRLADFTAAVCWRNGDEKGLLRLIDLVETTNPGRYKNIEHMQTRVKKWLDTSSKWHQKWSPEASMSIAWGGLPT